MHNGWYKDTKRHVISSYGAFTTTNSNFPSKLLQDTINRTINIWKQYRDGKIQKYEAQVLIHHSINVPLLEKYLKKETLYVLTKINYFSEFMNPYTTHNFIDISKDSNEEFKYLLNLFLNYFILPKKVNFDSLILTKLSTVSEYTMYRLQIPYKIVNNKIRVRQNYHSSHMIHAKKISELRDNKYIMKIDHISAGGIYAIYMTLKGANPDLSPSELYHLTYQIIQKIEGTQFISEDDYFINVCIPLNGIGNIKQICYKIYKAENNARRDYIEFEFTNRKYINNVIKENLFIPDK